MESFGIPGPEANYQALQEMAAANGELLQHVGRDMVTPLLDAVTSNDAGLKYVQGTLQRSLRNRTTRSRNQLSEVTGALRAALVAEAQTAQSLLAGGVPATSPGVGAGPDTSGPEPPVPEESWAVYYDPSIDACILVPQSEYEGYSTAQANNYRAGPFASRLEAGGWIADHPGQCVPGAPIGLPPPPPPPPPPTPPPLPCPVPPVGTPPPLPTPLALPRLGPLGACVSRNGAGFPEVGSPDFCACLDDFRAWFAELGRQATDVLFRGLVGPVETAGFLGGVLGSLLGYVGLAFPGANLVKSISESVLGQIKEIWEGISQVVTGAPLCNPAEILGITLARTFLHALTHVHVGWNLGVWTTTELAFKLKPLEDLLEYVANHACPMEVPAPEAAIECLLQGTATREQVRCWLAMRGISLAVWTPVVDARREKLSIAELIEFLRRASVADEEIAAALTRRGFYRPEEAEARVALYDELPTTSDFLHFLVRNVFDKQYVADYGLMEGFEERFWREYGADLRARGMSKRWAAEHYAAHWVNPAPTQMQEFVYRLRPEKPGVQNPFTPEDYARLLAEQDIAPFAAKRFQETLYRVPALGYLRDMYRQFILSDDELRSYHQDLGYTESDSERFVRIDRLQRDRMRATQAHGWNPAAIAKGYASRVLGTADVYEKMSGLGYTDFEADDLMERADSDVRYSVVTRARSRAITAAATEVRSAQLAGVMDPEAATRNLQNLGYPESMARGIALATDASMNVNLVKHATTRIRRALLSGEVTEAYAGVALDQLGVDRAAAARFLLVWRVENTPGRKRRTAAQITADVAAGQMETPEALVRLANLGYSDADSRLFLADAARRLARLQASALSAGLRGQRAQAKQLAEIGKEAERLARRTETKLRKLSPVGKLQKWVGLNIIGKAFFYSRMEAMGYYEPDIDRYYAEACAKKGAACAEAPTGSASAPASPGPGG